MLEGVTVELQRMADAFDRMADAFNERERAFRRQARWWRVAVVANVVAAVAFTAVVLMEVAAGG